jgi:hypothetical protein
MKFIFSYLDMRFSTITIYKRNLLLKGNSAVQGFQEARTNVNAARHCAAVARHHN